MPVTFARRGELAIALVAAGEGRRWTRSNHDLDRLIMRDGVQHGVEIKTSLAILDAWYGRFSAIPYGKQAGYLGYKPTT